MINKIQTISFIVSMITILNYFYINCINNNLVHNLIDYIRSHLNTCPNANPVTNICIVCPNIAYFYVPLILLIINPNISITLPKINHTPISYHL